MGGGGEIDEAGRRKWLAMPPGVTVIEQTSKSPGEGGRSGLLQNVRAWEG